MFWLNHSQNNCHLNNKQNVTVDQRQRCSSFRALHIYAELSTDLYIQRKLCFKFSLQLDSNF